ncbi:MarR family winged helix-turn-helix transcriptional regulator [Neobacillus paridis]|nr:MarR family transcriptional regulator [Neobacillus paridis]
MATMESQTAQKLLQSFMQFRKTARYMSHIAGYKPSEFKVLATIERGANNQQTEMKVSEISQQLQVTPPTVTQIINSLEKAGLVERTVDPEDRRAVKIKLTSAGVETTKRIREAFTEILLNLIDYLGEEESEQLAELLSKVHHYFQELNR